MFTSEREIFTDCKVRWEYQNDNIIPIKNRKFYDRKNLL